jgi:hypothetical protein
MTLEEFLELRALQDRRVQMTFSDGQVLIATLLSVTSDFDASRHLVYDKVEWSTSSPPENTSGTCYAAGEQLLSCTAYIPND